MGSSPLGSSVSPFCELRALLDISKKNVVLMVKLRLARSVAITALTIHLLRSSISGRSPGKLRPHKRKKRVKIFISNFATLFRLPHSPNLEARILCLVVRKGKSVQGKQTIDTAPSGYIWALRPQLFWQR